MKKAVNTCALLSLILFAGCSVEQELPPAYLTEKVGPLQPKPVVTNADIVQRALSAESAFEELRSKHNILIDWILPEPS